MFPRKDKTGMIAIIKNRGNKNTKFDIMSGDLVVVENVSKPNAEFDERFCEIEKGVIDDIIGESIENAGKFNYLFKTKLAVDENNKNAILLNVDISDLEDVVFVEETRENLSTALESGMKNYSVSVLNGSLNPYLQSGNLHYSFIIEE